MSDWIPRQIVFWNNTVEQWVIAGGTFAVIIIGLIVIKYGLVQKVKGVMKATSNKIDDVIVEFLHTISPVAFVFLALYPASRAVILPELLERGISAAFVIVIGLLVVQLGIKIVEQLIKHRFDGDRESTTRQFLVILAKIAVWSIGVLLILTNLGVEVGPLLASLGIGGLAVAFALQQVFEDIFSSVSIYLDKPFQVGDFVSFGDGMGTVEKIGIKTTRIRSMKGEELIVPNRFLTTTHIHNFGMIDHRRNKLRIGITYQTPPEKLREFTSLVTKLLDEKHSRISVNWLNLIGLGASSIDYELDFTVDTSEYVEWLKIQEEFILDLIELCAREQIHFAYPTQTIHLEGVKK